MDEIRHGLSSYAFCLRDERGDLIYAQGSMIGDTTNVEAEAYAILKATIQCGQSKFNKVII